MKKVGVAFVLFIIGIGLCLGSPLETEKRKISDEELIIQTTTASEVFDDSIIEDIDEDNFKYPTPPPALEGVTAPPDGLEEEKNDGHVKVVKGPIILGNLSCQCGTSIKTKIVGGEEVPISELPWTVALVRKRNSSTVRGPYCGGTLISNRYVLTASHCVDGFDAEKIQVWINEEDFRVENENLSGTLRLDVEEIIMHPEYDSKSINNDIALLRLAETVDFENGTYRPACLPADNSETYEKENAIVAGWGAKEQGGPVSATLQKVSVPIISNKACNWRTLYFGRITENQLCAGEITSGGKDSCQGDSGSSLTVENVANQKVLVGVVSYGYGCAMRYAPGVYTRVSRYPKWIIENSDDADYCSS